MTRPSGRNAENIRDVEFVTGFTKHAEGSCLVKFGDTHVLCTASVEDKVPGWMKNTGKGWVTAEYGMLPRSTHSRIDREAAKGKQSGRTQGNPALDWSCFACGGRYGEAGRASSAR